ncbi:hypothetical protein LX99_02291 [Mucilaginibacter oryzae]|uniref:Uncharacterized protein n=1 Tax=Mucilaginibacter oryzae TaxID=468058 RepID=A0A316HDG3_9SPHI|nr:hypothetical protein LX99_02291 [Mucilaginibacter oryzae]
MVAGPVKTLQGVTSGIKQVSVFIFQGGKLGNTSYTTAAWQLLVVFMATEGGHKFK